MRRAAIVTLTPAEASATDTDRAAPPAPRIVARMPGSCIADSSGVRNPVDVGVASEPLAAFAPQRVDGLNAAAHRIAFIGALERVDLERRRDAGAGEAGLFGKRREVVEVGGRQREIDGIKLRGAKRRVVHGR